jgi:hypothetical protein
LHFDRFGEVILNDAHTENRQAWLRAQQQPQPPAPAPRFAYEPSWKHTPETFRRRMRQHARQASAS